MTKILVISLLILLALGGGYFFYRSKVSRAPFINSSVSSSDTQLDSDLNSVDSQMSSLDTEQTGIDDGLNQQAPNLQ